MRLLCAWCEKSGQPAFLADVEPLDDPSKTHGICATHRRQVEDEVTRLREEHQRKAREFQDQVEDEVTRLREEHQRKAREFQDELKALRDHVDP